MIKKNQPENRKPSIILCGLIIVLAMVYYVFILRPQQQYYDTHYVNIHGVYLLHPLDIQDFELIDNHNKSFTKNNLKNHWTLLFFGFTNCGMVCPTTLSALSKMYTILEKNQSAMILPQVVFVTVDPERDTITKLNNYVTSFNSHFIGAKTTQEKTLSLENQFHIVSTKTPTNDKENYSINHSADIILINPDAKIEAYFSYPYQSDLLAKDYQSIIASHHHKPL